MIKEIPKKIVQPLDIKDEARPHSLTGGDISWPAIPPAAESLAVCVERGLLRQTEDGFQATGESGKHRVQWGEYELRILVHIIWPDIPLAGVPFEVVVNRVKRLRRPTG